jgi:hypothetical protein
MKKNPLFYLSLASIGLLSSSLLAQANEWQEARNDLPADLDQKAAVWDENLALVQGDFEVEDEAVSADETASFESELAGNQSLSDLMNIEARTGAKRVVKKPLARRKTPARIAPRKPVHYSAGRKTTRRSYSNSSESYGDTTYYSSGSSSYSSGDDTYYSRGGSSTSYGGTTFYSNGGIGQTYGPTTFYSNGGIGTTYGPTTFFSNGGIGTTYGGTTFFSSGGTCQNVGGGTSFCN